MKEKIMIGLENQAENLRINAITNGDSINGKLVMAIMKSKIY